MNQAKQASPPKMITDICSMIVEISKRQRSDFTQENLILNICCNNPKEFPRELSILCNQFQKEEGKEEIFDRDKIIRTFKKSKMRYPLEEEVALLDIFVIAETILGFLNGKKYSLELIDDINDKLDEHIQKRRLIFLLVINGYPLIKAETEAYRAAMRMNKDFAGECLDGIISLIQANTQQSTAKNIQQTLTPEEYQNKIDALEISLNRANKLLTRLQDSFSEQLADSKAEEEARVISMLNSEKYGFILDLLVSAQDGFRKLKKRKENIPFEIKSMQTLVRRLLEFTEDCNVSQILDIGEHLQVKAKDIESYSFNGTPFLNENDLKTVEVISPGWEIVNKDIIISYPRVREINEKE